MNRNRAEPQVPRHERELPSLVARPREDHHRARAELVEQVARVTVFVLRRDEQVLLLQRVHGAVLRADFHLDRVPQARALELRHLARHRRAEQLRPSVARDHLEDLVDLLLEVEVQQSVRLVQAQHLELLQAEPLRVRQVVDDSARGADDDVRALPELDALRHHVDAADEHRALDADAGAERLELLRDLYRELARWGEHEREERLGFVQELLEDRQRERAGLPAARLREADDVFPLKRLRDGRPLDFRGILPSEVRRRGRELLAHAERGERLDRGGLLRCRQRARHRGWGGVAFESPCARGMRRRRLVAAETSSDCGADFFFPADRRLPIRDLAVFGARSARAWTCPRGDRERDGVHGALQVQVAEGLRLRELRRDVHLRRRPEERDRGQERVGPRPSVRAAPDERADGRRCASLLRDAARSLSADAARRNERLTIPPPRSPTQTTPTTRFSCGKTRP